MATDISNIATRATDSTTGGSTDSGGTIPTNPGATLDKDAFLKLLLIELQHQDPTDPMDSEKMLTQTSQLAALEMQQNTNETMQKMVDTMNVLAQVMLSSGSMSAVAAVGKMAYIGDQTVSKSTTADTMSFKMYLPKATSESGLTLQIYDSSGKVIRDIKIDEAKSAGTHDFNWDGKDNDGNPAPVGKYTIKTSYKNEDGGTSTSSFGAYPIESIKWKDGTLYAKVGGKEIEFDSITEIGM